MSDDLDLKHKVVSALAVIQKAIEQNKIVMFDPASGKEQAIENAWFVTQGNGCKYEHTVVKLIDQPTGKWNKFLRIVT